MEHRNLVLMMISCLVVFSLSVEAVKDVPAVPAEGEPKTLLCTQFMENITSPSSNSKEPTPQMKTICGITRHPLLCEQMLAASHNESDTEALLPKSILLRQVKLMFGVTVLAYTDYVNTIQDEQNYENNNVTKIYLECMELYAAAGKSVRDAINACTDGDIKTTSFQVEAVIELYHTCKEKYEDAKVISPMKDINDFLTKLADNSLSMADAIIKGTV